ncbi:hypothetical protein RND71_020428 [Anisodus tanguticus]|uniref:Uncharacterized protein n=1 Tax=Anisodus tanguticus TaxID=243964 RepID=A0AAE1S2Q7_9SOLA|nr:hypothetical protein RND71_020428 [Anisodus tanguticus]
MLSTLSRFLGRIFTMGHQRSFHYHAMCYAESARMYHHSVRESCAGEEGIGSSRGEGYAEWADVHLDSPLLIKSQPGEIAKLDQFKAINDEGMLMYQRPFMRGKLYIHLTIDFRVITRAMKQQAAQEAYDEDDGGGAQRVQCA